MIRTMDTDLRSLAGSEGDPRSISVLGYSGGVPQGWPRNGEAERRTLINFRKHLELLDRWGFTLITLSDVHLFRRGHLHLPRRPMILTFDGLEDFLPLATVLQDVGGRAVLFLDPGLSTGAVEDSPDRLRRWTVSGVEIGLLLPGPGRRQAVSACELTEELLRSRVRLEELTGESVSACAYAAGENAGPLKRAVQDAGFAFAVAGPDGPRGFGSDPLEIRRQMVGPATGPLGLAIRAFSPGDRLVRLKVRSVTWINPLPSAGVST